MAATDTAQEILRVFRDVMSVEVPSRKTDILETGLLDSLALVTLLVELEERFGVRIDLETLDLEDLRTVESLGAVVDQLRTEGS